MMKTPVLFLTLIISQLLFSQAHIIDHRHTDISQIPDEYISAAKANLKIRYFRRSHGSQVDIGGMAALRRYSLAYAEKYNFNKTGSGGALFLSTQTSAEWNSLDFENSTWVEITRTYLDDPANAAINVVMWAWSSNFYLCSAQQYVDDMEMLIGEYGPGGSKGRAVPVTFVFQTACGQKSSERNAIVFAGNTLIREHCVSHNRILFDFNDLECYDPDGNYFGDGDANGNYTNDRLLGDDLAYVSSSPGGSVYANRRNWGIDWNTANPTSELAQLSADDICQSCEHSMGVHEGETKDNSRLHCVLKGRAAWYLWATLAGWQNDGPIVNVNGPYSATVNTDIIFSSAGTSSSNGEIISYLWSFGDGDTSSLANPGHMYTAAGTYTVKLTVTDDQGTSASGSTTATIVSSNLSPIADANGPYSGTVDNSISFTGEGTSDPDGTIASYLWSFGDGTTSTSANPTHIFSAEGTYTVVLSVADNLGATGMDTTSVTVNASSGDSSSVLLESYFETGWDGWSDGGVDVDRYEGPFSYEGNYSLNIRDNSGRGSITISPSIDVHSFDQVIVDFYFYADGMESGEEFLMGYFNGAAWKNIASYIAGTNFENGNFYHESVVISKSNYILPANAQFAFQCNASDDDDNIYIDAVLITGITTGSINYAENAIKPSNTTSEQYPIDKKSGKFRLYPNPAMDIVNVDFDFEDNATVEIYNLNGDIIKTVRLNNESPSVRVNDLSPGAYILKLISREETVFNKFIKK
jgi:PKD repeat protein